jgi:hypothetical protein
MNQNGIIYRLEKAAVVMSQQTYNHFAESITWNVIE